ncbi:M10 family metallopeptidase C-terminal domain-containing protein [uncultured Roseibium sp.]|uniref:M10 family metallopeptidase C-terminal domain-containing protein n=1 Tax=uncultured Roseibium sp. TaxID=1936171 RepID=UPI00260B56EC|nr:M10 family metallopeptidase C-terminal domain-containing protein [uncultured Roseibium sp.]
MSKIPDIGINLPATAKTAVVDASETLAPIANTSLVFQGDFTRAGPDLLIAHPEHGSLMILNYFRQTQPPDLVTTDGPILDGETVARLAGPLAPAQFAQAGTGLAAAPIGNVQSSEGTVTAQRADGSTATLTAGDPVFQGDVVQTGDGSSLVIVFVDETLFTLSADARMVLDELIYSPGGSDNSMVMNLVQGSFVFVTGQVAPTGDMRVETPTATMGIRGTTPIVQISSLDGATRFALAFDPGGQLGSYQLFDRVTGQLIGTVNTTDSTFFVPSPGTAPIITPRTPSEFAAVEGQLQQAYAAYGAAGLGQQNTNDNDGLQDDTGPGQTDAGQNQIEGGPVPDLRTPDLSPLGNGGGGLSTDGPAGSSGGGGSSPLDPGAPPPSNGRQQPGSTNSPDTIDDSGLPPSSSDDLLVFLPPNLVTQEDQSINFSGLNVEIPGDGQGTVTIVARSTVTLAQVSGLTFLVGDGIDDKEVAFSGSEADINAALASITYTPSPNSETGGLSLTVFDGETTLSADLPITIQPVEDPPIVYDIALNVDENGSVTAPFLGSDPDQGDTLTLYALSPPSLGKLEVSPDGTFTFDTNGDFDNLTANTTQEITFQYAAVDNTGLVSEIPATVTITVTGMNDAPVASDFALTSPGSGNSGFDDGFSGWQQVAGPQPGPNGEFIANNYDYSFDVDQSGFFIPGDDNVAVVQFSGWLDSWGDGPGRGTVFGPSLISDDFSAFEGEVVSFEYRSFFSVDDAYHTAELINIDTGVRNQVFLEQTPVGTFEDAKSIEVPIEISGTYRIEFKVGSFDASDGGSLGARLAIGTAGIVGTDVLAGGTQSFSQGRFLQNASDSDGDPITLESVSATSTFGAAVSIENGTVVYNTGNAFDFLTPGQTVTDTFQYTVSDGNGGFDTATASVDVVGAGFRAGSAALAYAPVSDRSAAAPQSLTPVVLSAPANGIALNDVLPSNAVSYSFPSVSQTGNNLTSYTPAQQMAAVAALSLWADVSGLTISEASASEPATVRFVNSTDVAFAETFDTAAGSTIITNPDVAETLSPDAGTYGFQALLHETGHALGLENAPASITQTQSVMSSVTPDSIGISWWNENGVWIYAQSPMVEDIAPVQQAYGINPQTRSGDTVYGFNSTETGSIYDFAANEDPVLTIYDADGVDVLDFSGWDAPAIIDLNPGAYSSVNGMTNNIGIAYGTTIEKAIGGAGNDLLIGTDLGETLDGGAGLDTLVGGGGADTFVLSHDDFADIIADFEVGEDRLDLSSLLEANFNTADVGDYVQVERNGDDAVLSVDKDGTGGTSDFRDVAVLQSVQAGGIIDFVFSDNGVQATDSVAA